MRATEVRPKAAGTSTDDAATTYAAPGVPRTRPLQAGGVRGWLRANVGMAQITVLNLVVFFVLWQVIANAHIFSSLFFPSPLNIARELRSMWSDGTLLPALEYSMRNLATGFAIAIVLGVGLGMLAGSMRWFNTIITPYYWSLHAMPSIAILPLMVLWWGYGREAKIVLIAFQATLIILINTLDGMRHVEPVLVKVARSLNATTLQRYRKVILPYTLPFILTGCKLGLSSALISMVVGEMLGSSQGLGYIIIVKNQQFDPAGVFAILMILAALSLLLVNAMQALQYRISPWTRNLRL